jgi:hypothetical protein
VQQHLLACFEDLRAQQVAEVQEPDVQGLYPVCLLPAELRKGVGPERDHHQHQHQLQKHLYLEQYFVYQAKGQCRNNCTITFSGAVNEILHVDEISPVDEI